ncbi:S-adenosyl-L-methionine-dependent methyltransferase, partial [Gigaspora rosea]
MKLQIIYIFSKQLSHTYYTSLTRNCLVQKYIYINVSCIYFRCGAGSWSFDIATTYPLAKVIGLDISPIQSTHIKPKNFEFIKANAQEGLPFDDNTFDFVFQRFLLVGYAKEKWPYVINEIVRVLKPGGFLELC